MRFCLGLLALGAASFTSAFMSATQLTRDITALNQQAKSFVQNLNRMPKSTGQDTLDINELIAPFVNLVGQGSNLANTFQKAKKKEPYMAEDGDKIVNSLTELAKTLEKGLNTLTGKLDVLKDLEPLNLGQILSPVIDTVKELVANLFGSLRQTLQGSQGRQVRMIARSIDETFEATAINLRR